MLAAFADVRARLQQQKQRKEEEDKAREKAPERQQDPQQQQQQQPQQQQQQQQGGSYLWWTEALGDGDGGGGASPQAPCPPDTAEIGRAAWAVLHGVAAYYPERPTREDREALRGLAHGLARLYPCAECRRHLPSDLAAASPPMRRPGQGGGEGADGDSGADDADGDAASSRAAAERWACKLHNSVNARLDKPAYDCARVGERWRDGWRDGSCGDQLP